FLGFITSYWITLAGLVGSALVILRWTWPGEAEGEHERPRALARHEGARSTGWWGMLMLIVFATAIVVPLVFSYVHIWASNLEWPPRAIDPPRLIMPLIFTALL